MGIPNISTYSVLQTTLTNVTKVEGELTTEQEQLSSGNKSQDFAGMADDAEQYLSLNNVLSNTNQYLTDNQTVETRINTTSSALTQVVNITTNLQTLLSQRLSGTSNSAFETQIDGIWQELAGQMNTSVGGQFIFGGTATTTPPVNPDDFPSTQTPDTPDASYYQGSQQNITARAQDGTVITYNVRADAQGFQQILAGLSLAKSGNAANDTDQLTQAESLVQSGLQNIINTQATVGAVASQFSNIDTNLNNQKLYWQGLQQTIGSTDIVSVSTQVAINQGILQAAFQAFAKISSLRLSDYLK